jgi:hypothetical protein
MESSSDIANAFQALSVLLVFNTLLFSMKYPQFAIDIDEHNLPESNLPRQLNHYQKRLKMNFWSGLFPILLLNIVCSYLVTPTAIKFVTQSQFSFLDFDFFKTAFVLVAFLLYGSTILSIYIGYCYIKLIR